MNLVWTMLSLDARGTPKGRRAPGQTCSSQRGRLTSPSGSHSLPRDSWDLCCLCDCSVVWELRSLLLQFGFAFCS